jgi:two-component system sensor histidine kinase PhoQ
LSKVYRDKNVRVCNHIDPGLRLRCDEADLMEILGNLLDNAFKWCHAHVEIVGGKEGHSWVISVHDDGPGINARHLGRILQRGGRADESAPGHGLGLNVAADIAEAYQGQLRIGSSLLGGAVVIVEFLG